MTLADIKIECFEPHSINVHESRLTWANVDTVPMFNFIDPKTVYMEESKNGPLQTMVNWSIIKERAIQAKILYEDYLKKSNHNKIYQRQPTA